MAVSIDEQIACAKRELAMRQRVYDRWVLKDKMSRAKADHELAAMSAIIETLEGVAKKERLI